MRFWDDMRSKYGFNDGGAVPDGAEVYRVVYIRVVNKLAEQLGSGVRAAAYDRAGVHNWCLILFYNVKDLAGHTPDQLTEPLDVSAGEVLEPDEAMDEAIQQAYLLDLDSFVEVTVDTADGFDDFVTALYPVNDPSRTQLEHRIISVSTLEFTHTIAFPQNRKLKRLSTELARAIAY